MAGHMLTKPQVAMITRGMRDGAPVYGAKYQTAGRLVALGFGSVTYSVFYPTLAGLEALREYRSRRWGKHGCMAYLQDLQEVEAAIVRARGQ